jgi:hypothetical protein
MGKARTPPPPHNAVERWCCCKMQRPLGQPPEAEQCAQNLHLADADRSAALAGDGLMPQWCKLNEVNDHDLGMARSAPLRRKYKKWSRHCVVARNEGWME